MPTTKVDGHTILTDERGFLDIAAGPSLSLARLNLGSKLFPTHLWHQDHIDLYVDDPEAEHGLELVWVPSALPLDLLSKLIAEIESTLKRSRLAKRSSSRQASSAVTDMRDTYNRLTEEGSNAYPRLAGSPQIVRMPDRTVMQVPIGPSKFGVALIRERNLKLPTARELSTQHILNSLAVRVAYIYEDTNRQRWIEFQQRQDPPKNATYGGAWDVSAAGYIDPQRHEDPKVPGRISPWQACASELRKL